MAAYMRSMFTLLSLERNVLLKIRSNHAVGAKRYVRGLRRTPVKILFPDSKKDQLQPQTVVHSSIKKVKKNADHQSAFTQSQSRGSGNNVSSRTQERSGNNVSSRTQERSGHSSIKEVKKNADHQSAFTQSQSRGSGNNVSSRTQERSGNNVSTGTQERSGNNDSQTVVHQRQSIFTQSRESGNTVSTRTQERSGNNDSTGTRERSSSGTQGRAAKVSQVITNEYDEVEGHRFERALPGDKRLSRVVSVARSRTFREQQGKILLEGRRLICDALETGANPQMVFFSKVEQLRELPLDKMKRATLVKVKFEDIKIWSDLVAPQGVIAIFARPDPSRLKFPLTSHSIPLSLICDNIRDAGNLGTILRCAAAAGCQDVLLTKGCVDAWEPKVLRAAMGAHFRVPIYPSLDWEDVEKRLPKQVTVHVADCCGVERATLAADTQATTGRQYEDSDSDSDSDYEDMLRSFPKLDTMLYHEDWAKSPSALVIGGETNGLSLEAVQLAGKTDGQRLFIPVVPEVDSLNAAMAASILLFEGRRQLLHVMEKSVKTRSI